MLHSLIKMAKNITLPFEALNIIFKVLLNGVSQEDESKYVSKEKPSLLIFTLI